MSKYGFATCGAVVLYNNGSGLCDDGYAYQFDNNGNLAVGVPGEKTGNAVWSVGGDGLYLTNMVHFLTLTIDTMHQFSIPTIFQMM